MAARGLRVLAVAVGDGPAEERLRMLGLIGIADPPRAEAIDAVATARQAGIRTVMITGDHPDTASAIAREMGIVTAGDDEREVVHARATPEDKLRIVRDLEGARGRRRHDRRWRERRSRAARGAHRDRHGHGPERRSLERRRTSSSPTTTSPASSPAIREGRGIFDNIRKSLLYLLGGNAGELALMLGAALLGLPVPLLPLQILWINLVTDGLPALALVMDSAGRRHAPALSPPSRRVDAGTSRVDADRA